MLNRIAKHIKEKEKEKDYKEEDEKRESHEKELKGPSENIYIRSQRDFLHKKLSYKDQKFSLHSIPKSDSSSLEEKYIVSENYVKLDYSQMNPVIEEKNALMKGKYSSLRKGIAYINPKVNEPHELLPGRPPRKVMIDRMKKVYSTINIESLLKKVGIDYTTKDKFEDWLPLDFFEDKDMDIYTPEEWMVRATDKTTGELLYIPGVGLHRDEKGAGTWRRVLINYYGSKTGKFEGIWDGTEEICKLSKIDLLFDAENPYLFCKKVSLAYQEREKAESIIRYNFYIDKMVPENLSDITEDQKIRLRKGIEKIQYLKMEQKFVDELLKELNFSFMRTTNKIIFDKFYYSSLKHSLITTDLKLPNHIINNPDIRKGEQRFFGLENVPSYNYIQDYKDFTFKTLLCRKEIIDCLQKIKDECNKIRNYFSIFFFDIKRPLRLQVFKQIQKSAIAQLGKKLETEWVITIKDTLEKSLNGVGKGSFNLNVASKEIYEYLKLKKYMTVVKLLMQDTLYSLVNKSIVNYVDFFDKFIPDEVVIDDVNKVRNIFHKEEIEDKLNSTYDLINTKDDTSSKYNESNNENDEDDFLNDPVNQWPLFQVNIMKKEDRRVEYTTKSEELIVDIMKLFDEGLERMQQIPQVEPLLLSNLIKKAEKQKIPLKSVMRPKLAKPTSTSTEQIRNGFELNDDAIWVWECYEKLQNSLYRACEPLKRYLDTFKKYGEDLQLDPNEYVRKIKDDKNSETWTNSKIREDIVNNKTREKEILNEIPQIIHVSFFQINCKEFRTDLANKFAKVAELEVEFLKEKATQLRTDILNGYQELKNKIQKEIVTIADLVAVQNDMESIEMGITKLKEKSTEIDEIYGILDGFNIIIDTIEFDYKLQITASPTEIENTKRVTNIILDRKKDKLYEEQIENQNKLIEEVEDLRANVVNFERYINEEKAEEAFKLADYVQSKLSDFLAKANMYNERENLFNKPRTNYSHINDLKTQFDPYYWLWTSIRSWKTHTKSWFEDNFSKLKGDEVEMTVNDVTKDLKNSISKFKERVVDSRIIELCQKYKSEVEAFKPKADLALAITKRGLKDRHWRELFNKTTIDCTPRDNFTFKNILDAGMMKNLEICQDVGEKASREFMIEEIIIGIDKKWREVYFMLGAHKTKVPTIINWNDINKILDEDIMEVTQLEVSPYKGPFADQIAAWGRDLLIVSNVLEEWNKVQKSWIYLQPVFDSGDIAKDIPLEFKKFMMTDRMWQDLMRSVEKPPPMSVKQNCSREGLLEKLREANMNLESVEKGLNDYMERKRAIFPRFFFISNSQFLEILSQTKDIKRVKDNLSKIFESIENIELKDEKYIISFMSRLSENLNLEDSVFIFGRNVEVWMKDLERMMFKTIRGYIERAVKDYLTKPRKDWVKVHPGQVLMHGNQVAWTREVELAIRSETLDAYVKDYDDRIFDLVAIVREKQTRLMSVNLSNLITIDVHNKNIMAELIRNNVVSTSAFEWIMQLRYYWESTYNIDNKAYNDECIVKSVQTDFPYGYEYMGNNEILVITPLTDKCYLTLMGALRLNLGGAPAGPAGTGKTESTKDLARSLAKLCIVYNCSDDTDYVMIGKFFKGLAFCGAWICFDEFNRINIEVLSVIAQQLSVLFNAKDNGDREIKFEDTRIEILPTFCVFITMNPGYAGRTELPDNLKALFRPIAMMVPDYRLIAEINLYSAGYIKASDLATKVVSTMKLSSEQLSTQGHYDFGMRAVKSVLNAARRLKRTELDTDEEQLLLRALEDVNVPKFLAEDIELFKNIISDLFPKVLRPKIDYSLLFEKVEEACKHHNLVPINSFKQKIIQLYDTLQVRHGLMLVGPSGGGKTSNYTILKDALSALEDGKTYFKTNSFVINPKAIRHTEIYSEQDMSTMEWSFGVLPLIINECKRDTSGKNKYWIIFDGPVDAMWIEDMNSVLDDSKKLCLASSDIILLNEHISLMFEVEDLVVASPATISRCGMVYMEPTALGLEPLVTCWINRMNKLFKPEEYKINETLAKLFNLYLNDSVYFVRKKLKEPCITIDNNLAKSVMRIIETFFEKFMTPEALYNQKKLADEIKNIENVIEGVFYYACIWSLGVTTNEDGRKKFSEFFKEQMKTKCIDSKYKLPEEGSVYDYMFDAVKGSWVSWMDTLIVADISPSATYTEIIVPTPDSIRYTFLIKQLVRSNKHVITAGPTGTGKTVNIMEILSRGLGDKYISIIVNFSAQTTARQTQTALEIRLKKYGRGKYGPDNNKIGAVFVDDLNMPNRQDSGAQPPIELLRQYLDHKGWYELKSKTFISVDNLFLLGAMGTGKNPLSQRFQRHFNLITYNELEDNSIKLIFNTILRHFLKPASEEIKGNVEDIVKSTLVMYKDVKFQMLPTPAKMHYSFNLRDISKVLQGVCSLSIKNYLKTMDVVRLWMHEMTRVFGDRLINDEDRDWLRGRVNQDAKGVFKLNVEEVYKFGKKIIFCDFVSSDAYSKNYLQVTNFDQFIKKINECLESYNENSKKKGLKLVMFLDACDHVSRICRILRQPQGNALLLGVGGSGRQSLARLATFINGFDCFQIEVIKNFSMLDFAKNVKDCLKSAGVKQSPTTFLIVDTQLVHPLMLEYINNILNSGDVPNLYKKEDMDEIIQSVKAEALSKFGNLQDSNVMKLYLARVMKNIHVVLAMSPMSEVFVQRLRMFPSLVNCCTLDWFNEWPDDALESVAYDAFRKNPMDVDQYIDGIVSSFKFIHKSVELESKEFSNRMRRYIYLTPTSYLELLNMYQKLLREKRNEYLQAIQRLENGLNVLSEAGKAVEELEKSIREQRPKLEEKQRDTKELLIVLEKENIIAVEEEKDAIMKEDEANRFDQECTDFLNMANEQLAKVWPLIEKARTSIERVKESDLRDLSNIKIFSPGVERLLEGLLIFKKGHSWRTKEFMLPPGGGGSQTKNPYNIKDALYKKINFTDYAGLKEDLKSFCVSEETLEPLKTTYYPYMLLLDQHFKEKEITYETCKQSAQVLLGLYDFLVALMQYVRDSKEKIDPIKIQVKIAEVNKIEANTNKDIAVAKKLKAQGIVKELNDRLDKTNREQKELERNLKDLSEKLERASQLIKLLDGERVRWNEDVAKFKQHLNNLIGDCLISAGAISYNGPFTHEFRIKLENEWRRKIKELNVIHSPGVTMIGSLKNEIEVREWTVNGLPEDNLSIENGIIIKNTRRWPLMIDPQNQGSTFIKKLGKRREILEVVKASDPNFLAVIIGAIRSTRWILLENVGVNLDPSLEPILNQQTTERGGMVEIKIGETTIPWSDKFKLFLSTTIPNPHYSPETFVKVTIINFGITPEGLEEQMMTLLINNEMPELEQRKNAILMENFTSMAERQKTEDKILFDLSKSEGGNIEEFLKSDELINSLKEAKTKSEEISQKIEEAKITSEQIKLKRESYRPAAFRSSLLFFATIDLSSIDPMYQFSLQWFAKLYESSIKVTPPSNVIETRISNLNKNFTRILFENVCRSLFEKDKLLFSFIICHKILTGEFKDTKIRPDAWRYFLAGPSGDIEIAKNPTDWISKNEWNNFYRQLKFMNDNFDEMNGLERYFFKSPEKFKVIYDSVTAHSDPLPDEWETRVSDFMKLCILKMIRPDKLIAGLQLWIMRNIGKEFVEPPPYSLHKSFKESSNIVPMIFILSPGSDPINDIRAFGEEQGFGKRFEIVSLGRGQEKKALIRLEDMRTKGGWVLLQNCHLAKSFMGKLEEIVENFDTNWPDKDFRLWLTSMSNDYFPVSILQNSVKITIEPPKGLKNNLLRTYNKLDNRDLEDCVKKEEYKALLFGLSFFHAIVQDRRKYGPIGWNVKYDFTNEDWIVCKKQIKIFLEQYEGIPFQVLDYLIGDINYGGRVTDDKDQRLIKNILKTYLTDNIFKYTEFKFSKSGTYFCPESGEQENYLNYIISLPVNSEPEVFGLHENADIVTAQNESYVLLETVLSIQPRVTGKGGKSMESMIMEILSDIEKKRPEAFDLDEIKKKFPTDYNESMNTVIMQEVIRYNVLLKIMKKSIKTLMKALTGKIVMTEDMEKMSKSLFVNQVPLMWSGVFLSLKPLSSWINDVNDRISFFNNWFTSGKTPSTFWISGILFLIILGFSFPQAFLTAALQNYARTNGIAIDLLSFEFKIDDKIKPSDIKGTPENGVYVYGMFMEGARWNYETHTLDESLPKELYTDVPMIHFRPVVNRELPKNGIYFCPLYKVLSRGGTLSTTGHSTNYVLYVEVPSDIEQYKWIKAGVAMFLALKQ